MTHYAHQFYRHIILVLALLLLLPKLFPVHSGFAMINCPNNSLLTNSTPLPLIGRIGSVFSSTLYNPADQTANNHTHNPVELKVRVTNNGQGVAGCTVEWIPLNGTGSGWAFARSAETDANGYAYAWWTAGTDANQTMTARITRQDNTTQQLAINGTAQGHTTRANSIHINWSSATKWDSWIVDLTPLSWPDTTYYSAINFPGGYTGIQSHQGSLFCLGQWRR